MNRAIIVAAGRSGRMQGTDKIIADLGGKPLLAWALEAFEQCADIDTVTVVSRKELFNGIKALAGKYAITKIKKIIEGGKERQDSVLNGAESLGNCDEEDIIIIHNGSNPFVSAGEISACISAAREHGAAACAFPLKDTIKKVKGGFAEQTLDRKDVWQMQTPQCARYGILKEAFSHALKNNAHHTDDAAMVEALGKKVKIVPCSARNFKVTTPEDLEMATRMISGAGNARAPRVGLGQDSHRFSAGKKALVLGGCTIPHEQGLEGNSDADVILHALFNAISSALGGRSLSIISDGMCKKGITDSREYLKAILEDMGDGKWAIGNVSVSIEAKKPKLEPHHDAIKKSLCALLGIGPSSIGLTFTSGEGLTGFGRGEGMQCFCAVTLVR